MTESETIEKLKNMRLFMQIEDEKNECKFTEDDYKANDMAIQALEKQIPKKPLQKSYMVKDAVVCPICEFVVLKADNYCSHCGQHLDWSDKE